MKKNVLFAGVVCGVLTLSAITVQNVPSATVVRQGSDTVVVNTAAPKYSLNEAIELSIREITQRGENVTVGAVKNRLQRMPASDVDLNVNGLSRTIREAVEAHEAALARELPAPDPAKYDKREKFVADYAKWKQDALTPAQRKDLHARMGAESKFRSEAKAEAAKVWENGKKAAQ